MLQDDETTKGQWLLQAPQKSLRTERFSLQVKSFAHTTPKAGCGGAACCQQLLHLGGERETSLFSKVISPCLSSMWDGAKPCWTGTPQHAGCQPCCRWDHLENTTRQDLSSSWRSLNTSQCSWMPHPCPCCPAGTASRTGNSSTWVWHTGVNRGKESPVVPSRALNGACSKPNQTIIFK